jgi:hypothetical protein
VALAETSIQRRELSKAHEPTVSGSLEHLISSSQSVITRRIDLALLETQVLLKEFVEYAGFYAVAIVLAACTWLAATAALSLFIIPFPNWAYRLGVFALLNGAGAGCCVLLARRHTAPVWTKPSNGNGKTMHAGAAGEAPADANATKRS